METIETLQLTKLKGVLLSNYGRMALNKEKMGDLVMPFLM